VFLAASGAKLVITQFARTDNGAEKLRSALPDGVDSVAKISALG